MQMTNTRLTGLGGRHKDAGERPCRAQSAAENTTNNVDFLFLSFLSRSLFLKSPSCLLRSVTASLSIWAVLQSSECLFIFALVVPCVACGVSVPWISVSRVGNYIPCSRVQSLNHWTTREVSVNSLVFLILLWKPNSSAHHSPCQLQERRSQNQEPSQSSKKEVTAGPHLSYLPISTSPSAFYCLSKEK